MKIRFWGTRGSLAKASSATLRYGGNTSCVEVRSASGALVVIDCGTGLHALGEALMSAPEQPLRGFVLISHTHWDHIQGIPFFAPFFASANEWDIYAPRGLGQSLRETLAGQMQYTYCPVTLEAMGATIRYHELVEGVFQIDDFTVRTCYLNHPALTLGYRLEAEGVSMVYACDHEPVSKRPVPGDKDLQTHERRHVEFIDGADLVIHDAQYTADEYRGKMGWGHSTAEYAAAVCHAGGVKKLVLTHHDPNRDDDAVDRIIARMRATYRSAAPALEISAAAEGKTIDLGVVSRAAPQSDEGDLSAVAPAHAVVAGRSMVLGEIRSPASDVIRAAAEAEGVRPFAAPTVDDVLRIIRAESPSLVVADASVTAEQEQAIRTELRVSTPDGAPPVTIAIVAEQGTEGVDDSRPDVEWLIWPFKEAYARTKIRAWALRMKCMWLKARLPDDEHERLAELHALGILDTEPEDRFDRITRIASAALETPIALVSLVDRDRQWFKSCFGLDARETPRDMAFCAHAILDSGVFVVPDTLSDPRFADNPLVTGPPRIRFYAGCPLRSPGNFPLGTLCVIDVKPRQLDGRQVDLLKDLAGLVERELAKAAG